MRCNKIPVVIDLFMFFRIYLGSQMKKKTYFEKSLSPLQGILVYPFALYAMLRLETFEIEGAFRQEIL